MLALTWDLRPGRTIGTRFLGRVGDFRSKWQSDTPTLLREPSTVITCRRRNRVRVAKLIKTGIIYGICLDWCPGDGWAEGVGCFNDINLAGLAGSLNLGSSIRKNVQGQHRRRS